MTTYYYFKNFLLFFIILISSTTLLGQREVVFQGGHTGAINKVVLLPDKKMAASCGDDGKILLWNLNTGSIVARFESHYNGVEDVAFQSGKPIMASIDGSGEIHIWNLNEGKIVATYYLTNIGPVHADTLAIKYHQSSLSPGNSRIYGGQLAFVDDKLLVGLSYTYEDASSSLFSIRFEEKEILPYTNMPKDKYGSWFSVKQMEQIDQTKMLLLTDDGMGEKNMISYNISNNKIENRILKGENIESFAYNPNLALLAVEVGYDETNIYNTTAFKMAKKVEFSGAMTWENDKLWIASLEEIKAYNSSTDQFENIIQAENIGSQMVWLSEFDKLLHVNRFEGMSLIDPVRFSLVATSKKFMGNDRYGYPKLFVSQMGFLNNNQLIIQASKSGDYVNNLYLWDLTSESLYPQFDYQEPGFIGTDQLRDLFIGMDLDSTSATVDYYIYSSKEDMATIDVAMGFPDSIRFVNSFNYGSVVGVQEDYHFLIYFDYQEDSKGDLYVIDYLNSDTLYTLSNIRQCNAAFFDPISKNMGIWYYNNPEIDFYHLDGTKHDAFYKIIAESIKLITFDGKNRWLVRVNSENRLINLSYPEKVIKFTDANIDYGVFHPTEPWMFYGEDLFFNGVICYDYENMKNIGGIAIEEEQSKDYLSPVENMRINKAGDRLALKLGNNKLFVFDIQGFGSQTKIGSGMESITNFVSHGSYLYLEQSYSGSNIINLENLSHVVDFLASPDAQNSNETGLKAVSFSDKYVTTYTLKNYKKEQWNYTDLNHIIEVERSDPSSGFTNKDSIFIEFKANQPTFISSIINNRYLLFHDEISTFFGSINYHGLWIFDLVTKSWLVEAPEICFDGMNTERSGFTYFYRMNNLYEWKIGSDELKEIDISPQFITFPAQMGVAIPKNDNNLYKSEVNSIYQFDLNTGKKTDSILSNESISQINLLNTINRSALWVCVYSQPDSSFALAKINLETKEWDSSFVKLTGRALKMGTTEDGRFLIVSLDNGELLFHDINTGKPVVRFWVKTNGELFVSDELGNYHASTTGFQPYKMKYNGVIYDFQYIDLTYNRPDILIKKLGYADEQLVGIYTDAVKKRALMQGGGVSTNLVNIPQINITNMPDQFITSENFMVLEGKVENSPTGENKLKLTVNGHPQLMDLENPQRLQVPINLNKGANYIEMAIVDKSGIIFPSQQWILYSKKEKAQRNLVVCVLSVSKYMDNTYNLTYARKDGEDIVQTFAAQSMNYDKVYFHQLYDQQVTLEKIDSLFTSINVSPNDRLIVFISGHGLLDAEKEFYYATHDVDFEDPKNCGFSFDQLQSYMSDINTPEKLLLIDACHSGLVDKTESEKRPEATEPSEVKLSNVFAAKGTKALNIEANEVTLKNSFELMQELFQNFSSFTGTETITAASGNSWALESSKWKNGAFTFVIKKGLLEFEADLNNNGTITIDELKKYVTKEVLRLTNGAQKPTSRETNDYLDWVVWD